MSPSASTIILEYVCPALGCLVGNYMFLAPYHDIQKAIARGYLGDLNPLPWAFMLGNCIGWLLYSFLIRNFFVFAGNLPGMFLGAWFNMAATKLLYRQQFTSLPTTEDDETSRVYHTPKHDYWVIGIVAAWAAVIAIVGFGESLSADTKQFIVGVCGNVNVLFFYGAPLSTIFTVINERNTASIHFKTMVTNTTNAIFWSIYGFAVVDYYIFVPNALGSLLGFVQIALYMIFPRKAAKEQFEEGNIVTETEQISKQAKEDEEEQASGLTARTVDDVSENPLSRPFHTADMET